MTPLESFLRQINEIHSSHAGVDETSYYGALETLLNEAGKTLKPRVRCIIHIRNRGAGLPDGGLFTAEQFDKDSRHEPSEGTLPTRGAIEVKPPRDDIRAVALSEQVLRYLDRYRQVLVTNLRQFALVGRDLETQPAVLEPYTLASREKEFWDAAAHPRITDKSHGVRFAEYLRRVMLHAAPLGTPEDLAFFLASYARDALARVEETELDALAAIRGALEEALGLKFEGKKGEHFFRSSLIQTLFYGVFSAWVLWARKRPPTSKDRFDWNATARLLKVPVIRKLFHEVSDPGQLEALNLTEVLDWSSAVLNRVDRAQFFSQFRESEAVQYFYEPFLVQFDPELRKELGVWYTPPEIVKYMVHRVDTVLREELRLPDGLADKNVYILDPCCGTGSYLVETLKKIREILTQRGDDALIAADLKEAAQKRIFGFEILPAPFVVSHLQLGLLLQNLGAPLSERGDERVGVYLTNALTGWEPPKGPKQHLIFPELEEERDAAEHVKRDTPILVIIGNPPYNAFAGLSPAEEHGLVEPYKTGLVREWGIKKFNLDDLYVRFFRLAERRIVEKEAPGRGVLAYISNFSYLGNPSFVVMRRHLLTGFQNLWFDCMNGDSRETGKITPDGKPDPSVFSTEYNREGIRVGTAIAVLVRHGGAPSHEVTVKFRHFWGVNKRSDLIESLKTPAFGKDYLLARPDRSNRFSFRPQAVEPNYLSWPTVESLANFAPSLGILENRREALISIDKAPLEMRMREYLNPDTDWESYVRQKGALTEDLARFDAKKTRDRILKREKFDRDAIRLLMIRPMDIRWCYYTSARPLWNEPRPEYVRQVYDGNAAIVTRRRAVASPEGVPFYITQAIGFQHGMQTDAYYIPIWIKPPEPNGRRAQAELLIPEDAPPSRSIVANLSLNARGYLCQLGLDNPDHDRRIARLVWEHVTAIGYSPAYITDNADGVRQDWPHIPLPDSSERLNASAALGEDLIRILNPLCEVDSITSGNIRRELRAIGSPTRQGGGSLSGEELKLSAGWGHENKDGVIMPGQGKLVERDYSEAERAALMANAIGLTEKELFAHLGQTTCDLYLNDVAYWTNIPIAIWNYRIGGYQVIKKWLSYREGSLLGRPLMIEEVRYVQHLARRLTALLLLEPALNRNYETCKENAYEWSVISGS